MKCNGKSALDRLSTGTNQKALACQADQSRKRAACQRNSSLATFSSPLQGSFHGGSYFSASAPRLASTLFFSFAFAL